MKTRNRKNPKGRRPDPTGGLPLARVFLVGVFCALAACSTRVGQQESPDKVIYALREENRQLRDKVGKLEDQVQAYRNQLSQRVAALDAADASQSAAPSSIKVEAADIPRPGRIEFGRYTNFIDTDDDQTVDTLRLYVRILDQFGRFHPATGRLQVEAAVLIPDAQPMQLVSSTFDPKAFTDAFRSGFTGTHYTFEIKLPSPLPPEAKAAEQAAVQMTFTDAETGMQLQQQRTLPLAKK